MAVVPGAVVGGRAPGWASPFAWEAWAKPELAAMSKAIPAGMTEAMPLRSPERWLGRMARGRWIVLMGPPAGNQRRSK